MAEHTRATAGMGGKKSGAKKSKSGGKSKHPHSIHVRRGASGGFIVEHHFKPKNGEMSPEGPDEHVVGDMDQLQQHLAEHMGDQPEQMAAPGPQEPEGGQAPAAMGV